MCSSDCDVDGVIDGSGSDGSGNTDGSGSDDGTDGSGSSDGSGSDGSESDSSDQQEDQADEDDLLWASYPLHGEVDTNPQFKSALTSGGLLLDLSVCTV